MFLKIVIFLVIVLFASCSSDSGEPVTYTYSPETYDFKEETINYYVHNPKREEQYYHLEQKEQEKILDYIRLELSLDINLMVSNKLLDKRYLDKSPIYQLKLMIQSGEVDLVFFNEFLYLEHNFKMNEDFTTVDPLIEKHAPNIYSAFPESYWKYRENTGQVYGIPVKMHTDLDRKGFWVIKKELLPKYYYDQDEIISNKTLPFLLIELLNSKNINKNFLDTHSKNNKYRGLQNLDEFSKDFENIMMTPYRSIFQVMYNAFFNYKPLIGYGEFWLGEKAEINLLNESDLRILQNMRDSLRGIQTFSGIDKHNSYFNRFLFLPDWGILYIPGEFDFHYLTEMEMERLKKRIDSGKYIVISDFGISEKLPFDNYQYLYIPKTSGKAEIIIKILNLFMGDRFWYDLFNYGTEILERKTMNEYTVKLENWIYTNNLSGVRERLGVLTNQQYKKIPYFYPEIVIDEFVVRKGIAEKVSQYTGYDMYKQYNLILSHLYRSVKNFSYFKSTDDLINLSSAGLYEKRMREIELVRNNLERDILEYLKE